MNKFFVKCLLIYLVATTYLTFARLNEGQALYDLALWFGLKQFKDHGWEPNVAAFVAFVVLGIGLALGLSYVYPESQRLDPKNNGRQQKMGSERAGIQGNRPVERGQKAGVLPDVGAVFMGAINYLGSEGMDGWRKRDIMR